MFFSAAMECNKRMKSSGQISGPSTIHGFITCVIRIDKTFVGYYMKCTASLKFKAVSGTAGCCVW